MKKNTFLKKINFKMIWKILSWIAHIVLLLCMAFFMWMSHVIIYDDFYQTMSIYIIDFSNMDFFKTAWAFWVISNIVIAVIARFYNKVFSVIHFLLSQFSIVYFCWLLTL